jgi:hypothetical protein
MFDIAWSGLTPTDTTYWGTLYQVNVGDPATYNGMLEYEVQNWNTSNASIRRFELMFDASLFTSQVAISGTPTGWELGVDSGASGAILIWGRTNTNAILPGQSLNGFLVDFTTNQTTPASSSKFVQAYDVYQLTAQTWDPDNNVFVESGSGQHGKGITTPVPEPASMLLLGMGVLGLVALRKKT